MSDMFSDALEFCDGLDVCDRQNLMRELDVSYQEEETTSASLATELTFILDREKRRKSFEFGRGLLLLSSLEGGGVYPATVTSLAVG
jgi:hypothetical protein